MRVPSRVPRGWSPAVSLLGPGDETVTLRQVSSLGGPAVGTAPIVGAWAPS